MQTDKQEELLSQTTKESEKPIEEQDQKEAKIEEQSLEAPSAIPDPPFSLKNRTSVLAILKPKQPYNDFALQELKSLLAVEGIDIFEAFYFEQGSQPAHPVCLKNDFKGLDKHKLKRNYFVHLSIKDEDLPKLERVVSRSVMVRNFLKLYGEGENTESMLKELPKETIQHELDSEEDFYFYVTATFKSIKYILG